MASKIIKGKLKLKTHSQDFIPSFIRKTYDILEENKFPQLIDWNPEGTAIVIKKPSEFSQKVLPVYFKHNNLTSFVRQLNMYNFHKRRSQNLEHVYSHELFQKGKRHLLKEIKRKTHDQSSDKQKSPETSTETPKMEEVSTLYNENQFLKRLYNEAMGRVAMLENQAKELSLQNQSLWAQVYRQNEPEKSFKPMVAAFETPKDFSQEQTQMNLSKVTLKLSPGTKPPAPITRLFTHPFSAPNHAHVHNNNNNGEESTGSTEVSPTSPAQQTTRVEHEATGGNIKPTPINPMNNPISNSLNPMNQPLLLQRFRVEPSMATMPQMIQIPHQMMPVPPQKPQISTAGQMMMPQMFHPSQMTHQMGQMGHMSLQGHIPIMRIGSDLNVASRQEISMGQIFESWNADNDEILTFADQQHPQQQKPEKVNATTTNNNVNTSSSIQAIFQDKSLLGKRKLDLETPQNADTSLHIPEPSMKRHDLCIFNRKGIISTGIEDKEIRETAMGSVDDVDLMDFAN